MDASLTQQACWVQVGWWELRPCGGLSVWSLGGAQGLLRELRPAGPLKAMASGSEEDARLSTHICRHIPQGDLQSSHFVVGLFQ